MWRSKWPVTSRRLTATDCYAAAHANHYIIHCSFWGWGQAELNEQPLEQLTFPQNFNSQSHDFIKVNIDHKV